MILKAEYPQVSQETRRADDQAGHLFSILSSLQIQPTFMQLTYPRDGLYTIRQNTVT